MFEFYITVLAILVTVAVGAVSVALTLRYSRLSTSNQTSIKSLISQISGLFSASQRMGIVTAYENRKAALLECTDDSGAQPSFVSRFDTEKKLVVVGSSLLGLRMYVNHLQETIVRRVAEGRETRFMLTHPCISNLRESQENREKDQIRKEIEETVGLLSSFDIDLQTSLRFYLGTPTCFLVITSEAMVINPYPYQTEAFKAFTLEVRRIAPELTTSLGEEIKIPKQVDERFQAEFMQQVKAEPEYDYRLNKSPDIYGQYYWYHYFLPWHSSKVITYDEYDTVCSDCPMAVEGYRASGCEKHRREKAADACPAT